LLEALNGRTIRFHIFPLSDGKNKDNKCIVLDKVHQSIPLLPQLNLVAVLQIAVKFRSGDMWVLKSLFQKFTQNSFNATIQPFPLVKSFRDEL